MWDVLPDVILEKIFCLLTLPERYHCSMVCNHWYETFFSPCLWRHLVLNERSFTSRRYVAFKGYQYDRVNFKRIQKYLSVVGHNTRRIKFAPISIFYNLYSFLEVLACFLEFFEDYPMPCLDEFDFTFACESRGADDYQTFITGTGGQILAEIKKLLSNMRGLTRLKLNQLLLDLPDAGDLLTDVVRNSGHSLRVLEILNCTKKTFPLMSIIRFTRLQTLVISTQQLSPELLTELASRTPLETLIIVQDRYTPCSSVQADETENDPPAAVDVGRGSISPHVWLQVRQISPKLRVRLECRGQTENDITIQDNAPVSAIVYDTPTFLVKANTVVQITDYYRPFLRVYAHLGLPRSHQPRSFHDRADTLLVLLVRECSNLETLVVRDRISTATLLVISGEGVSSLRRLVVRRNAVILRSDWPRQNTWSDEYYSWLGAASRSYEIVEVEMKKRFGPTWKMLSDREFKGICQSLRSFN